jgi:hypothetical protein
MGASYMLRMLNREDRRLRRSRVDVTRGRGTDFDTIHLDLPVTIRPAQKATVEKESGGRTITLNLYEIRMEPGTDILEGDVCRVIGEDRFLVIVEVPRDDWQSVQYAIAQETRSAGLDG